MFTKLGSLLLLVALAVAPGCPRSRSDRLNVGAQAVHPVVAMDGSGNGTIVWIEPADTDVSFGKVASVNYVHDSGFDIPGVIYDERPSRDPVVAMDALQGSHVVLSRISIAASAAGDRLLAFGVVPTAGNDRWRVMASADSAGSPWSAPFVLATLTNDQSDPVQHPDSLDVHVAMNGAGIGAIAYTGILFGSAGRFVHRFEPGTDPLLPERVDVGGVVAVAFEETSLLITSDGTVLVFWAAVESGSDECWVFARSHLPGQGWEYPQKLGRCSVGSTNSLNGGVDANGNALISIDSSATPERELYAWSPLSRWSGPLAGLPDLDGAELSVAADASAILVGGRPLDSLHPSVSFLEPGGTWSQPRHFGTTATEWNHEPIPSAIDGSGTALCAWINTTGLHGQVWRAPTAEFEVDGAPPAPGTTATFTALPTRLWTTGAILQESEWDFDGDQIFDVTDDDPSDGHLAKWIWPAAGTYPVTLRVTDDWGRVGVVTRDVVVDDGGGSGSDWLLTVAIGGSGAGRVTSDFESDGTLEIDCPADCEERCADGMTAYLRPFADVGFVFDHWEGLDILKYHDVDNGVEGCLVQMVADRAITAVFKPSL